MTKGTNSWPPIVFHRNQQFSNVSHAMYVILLSNALKIARLYRVLMRMPILLLFTAKRFFRPFSVFADKTLSDKTRHINLLVIILRLLFCRLNRLYTSFTVPYSNRINDYLLPTNFIFPFIYSLINYSEMWT